MPLAIIHSRARTGIESPRVAAEVDLASGLPSLSIVGLAETAVKESKHRVRSEALETVDLHISRVARRQRYPADFQLVAAMNPCRCSPDQVRKYQERVCGLLLDRIEIHAHVKPVDHKHLAGESGAETAR